MKNLFKATDTSVVHCVPFMTNDDLDDGIDEYCLSKDLCEIYGIKSPEDADDFMISFTEAMMLVSIGYSIGYAKGRRDKELQMKHMGRI